MKHLLKKQWLSALLCLALLLGMIPGAAALTPGTDGFVFAAATAGDFFALPEQIPAAEGQTILQALEAAGHAFGIDGGFLYEVDGRAGNYSIRDNRGGYDLNAPAAGISSLIIGENTGLNEDADALVLYLADFYSRTDLAANYGPVASALTAALTCLQKGSDFAGALGNLQSAVAEYEALMNGNRYTVTFSVTKGSSRVTNPVITLTDSYGNVTSATGTQLSLLAGSYSFVVSDGGYNRTEGSLTVSGNSSRSVALPDGEWYGAVSFQDKEKTKYPSETNQAQHQVTIHVPDTMGTTGLYLNAAAGAIPGGTQLRTVFVGVDGKDKSTTTRSWNSNNTSLSQLLNPGMEGRVFDLEARYADGSGDTQIQSYTVTVDRLPTLSELRLLDNGANGLSGFAPEVNSYEMDAVSDTLTVAYAAFGPDYQVTVNGGSSTEVPLSKGTNTLTIALHCGSQVNTYTVLVNRVDSVPVTLKLPADTEVEVYNAAGAAVAPISGSTYPLIAGQSYRYVAAKGRWYHTAESFVAQANLTLSVAEPETADAMKAFAMYQTGSTKNRVSYLPDSPYSPEKHQMTYRVSDANAMVYVQATREEGYSAHAIYTAHATSESLYGSQRSISLTNEVSDSKTANGLTYCLISGGYGRAVTLRLTKEAGTVTYYQDYEIQINRSSHMKNLALFDENGEELLLYDGQGNNLAYDRDVMDYTVNVTDSAEALSISGEFYGSDGETPVCGGYSAEVAGESLTAGQKLKLALNPELEEETLTLTVSHADAGNSPAAYTFHVVKLKPMQLTVSTTPAEARVFITNNANGKTLTNKNGTFALTPGNNYTVTVTAAGYVGQSFAYTAPEKDDTLPVILQAAEENTGLTELDAQWPYFRADANNNGLVDVRTPKNSDEAVLYWANHVGEGWDTGACGCPILVDGCLYVYADTRIVKVDSLTGETLAVGDMDRSSSFAINSPTYAHGMIFVGLSNGGVQAFDAVTLESLWIYNDPLKGQPNCPIYYCDGYIYTGFWNGETLDANYICLSVTDEDPANHKEEKLASWTYTRRGGFYWSGAYVNEHFALIPTDDGSSGYTSGYAALLSIDPATGNVIDVLNLPDKGDARSSVCYDEASGKYWFATKGGYVYGASVNADGSFNKNQLSRIALYNYATDASNPAMSTCTPAIYKGRLYVGVSGVSQFGAYSGHNLTVIDLTTESIAYTVRTQGYPQTSGLVTSAYEEEEGAVYVYFFDNYTPGKLRVIRDRPGQTAPDEIRVEETVEKGVTVAYDTAPVLFTPDGAQAQYAICSPIADRYGTIYFKNDSGYLMALGSTIKSLEITALPDKLDYTTGESFDPTGMEVTATYANGLTRDVTNYVSWSKLPLTMEDRDFIISYETVMYQDKDGLAGVEYTAPSQVLTLNLTEFSHIPGDMNDDGKVNLMDVSLLFHILCGDREEELPLTYTDLDEDGRFSLKDVACLFHLATEERE